MAKMLIALWICFFIFSLTTPLPVDKNETQVPSYAPEGKRLIFAHAIWRHGARAPNAMYPNSLNTIDDFVQDEGELVQKGMLEQFNLGLRLRKRFVKQHALVSPRFRSKEIYIRSTGFNRTVASAMSNFLGFYHTDNVKGEDYPDDSVWPSFYTPVPVFAVLWHNEELFNLFKCNRALQINALIPQTPEFHAFIENYQPLFELLGNNSGLKVVTNSSEFSNLHNAYKVCDCIICEESVGLPIAPWATDIIPECRQYISDFYGQYLGIRGNSTVNEINVREESRRTFSGKLVWEIIERFQTKLDNHLNDSVNPWIKELVYFVYSAHDTSLMQLSSVLGFDSVGFEIDVEPETSDAVTLELWVGDDNSTVIKVLHLHRDNPIPVDISKLIPGCENTIDGCSLKQLAAKSEKYKNNGTYDELCSSSIYDPQPNIMQTIEENAIN